MTAVVALSIPTPSDFASMATLQTAAFAAKQGWMESSTEIERQHLATYQRYHRECPTKLEHCRIIKCPTDGVTVPAACQLNWKRIAPKEPTASEKDIVVFVEWIASHPDYMNQGMGSALLDWAGDFAKKTWNVDTLTLYVIKANKDAIRLYARRGFDIVGDKNGGRWAGLGDALTTLLCGGLDRHWTIYTMEKNLSDIVPSDFQSLQD